MAKKKQRAKQVSKGERNSVARNVVKAQRRDYMNSFARLQNQFAAYKKGKRVSKEAFELFEPTNKKSR